MLDGGLMFERFTSHAKQVVVLSQEEARRLEHNYIGTEHILLGLVGDSGGVAAQVLQRFGMSLDGAREEVRAIVGTGNGVGGGHIPFTPRAKKTLELALREALQLKHNYIGTEHILLGVIAEGDGVGAQVLRQHSADLAPIRTAVLDLVSGWPSQAGRGRRWLRLQSAVGPGGLGGLGASRDPGEPELRTTPAADASLDEAARLAGAQPLGSHHLLLAALGDPDTAAARALAALGVDLDQAREALRNADVTGTSDEQPEEAGRRQMRIRVTDEQLTIEATDPVIIGLGRAALQALGDQAEPSGIIRGDLPVSASLSTVWQALHDSLLVIQRRATLPAESPALPDNPDKPDQPGTKVA
jgi:ATP-dependent Clp protease ATP-binding subunit ClpA